MAKKIKANTFLFAMILTFVMLFGSIFGENNNTVGVTVIITILVFMGEDLTDKPVKHLIKLLLINLSLGILSQLSSNHMWLGLVVNFVVLSAIGYWFSSKMNKVMVVPFGLQYLFMLYSPVTGNDFTKRLLGLAAGAVMVMAVQLWIHRKDNTSQNDISAPVDETLVDEGLYNHYTIFGKSFSIHKVRGAYAVRIGLLTALTAFITAFFDLQQGRWIVYTIFSLTELYSENCSTRAKQRLEGTVIGALIILFLFIFIKDNSIRVLLVLVGGYLDSYTTNYRDKMICVTMSVVASVSLINGTAFTAVSRIVYVFIGILLAILVDKLVFTKTLNDSNVEKAL